MATLARRPEHEEIVPFNDWARQITGCAGASVINVHAMVPYVGRANRQVGVDAAFIEAFLGTSRRGVR
jgi:hypothetical protein